MILTVNLHTSSSGAASAPAVAPPYTVRRLGAGDVAAYRSLRMAALRESPTAFGATPESEQALTDEQVLRRLEGPVYSDATCRRDHSGMWGAWNDQRVLVGCVGLLHLPQDKLGHKATLFAVYVAPCARGQHLARQMLEAVTTHARTQTDLRQLQLSVTAGNTPALRLYHSMGFVAYGQEPAALYVEGRYHDEILMQLPLRG